MAKVAPVKSRIIISEELGGIKITVPIKRNWFLLLFLGFWLCGWAVGEIMVPRMAFRDGKPGFDDLFSVAWLGMWTIGGALAIFTWLWNLAGREVISFLGTTLVIRRQIGRWGRSQEFDLTQVRDLRAAGMFINPWSFNASLYFWGIGGGNIAFDYGAKTYRFGASLEEAEARQLVKTIKERFPIPEDK